MKPASFCLCSTTHSFRWAKPFLSQDNASWLLPPISMLIKLVTDHKKIRLIMTLQYHKDGQVGGAVCNVQRTWQYAERDSVI